MELNKKMQLACDEHLKMIKDKGYCDLDHKCREIYKDKIPSRTLSFEEINKEFT